MTNTHHSTQYGVVFPDGRMMGPAPSIEYCEQILEEAQLLAKKNPEYEKVHIVSRVITTIRTDWEPVEAPEVPQLGGGTKAEEEPQTVAKATRKRGRPKKVSDAA